MGQSLAQQVAELDPDERAAVLAEMDSDALLYDASFWMRPEQMPRDDEAEPWHIHAIVAGRGFGKTRAGAEWCRKKAQQNPGSRGFLVARTASDVRDVMIEGESGLVAISPPSERPEFQPSKRRVVWPNGSQAITFTSEEPSQLRGPQAHWAWGDEVAAWRFLPDDSGLNAWENMVLATRLGEYPQVLATTTPKRTPFMQDLVKRASENARVEITRGATMDNAGNLSEPYLDFIMGMYEGTRLAQQELWGIMLDEVEGAIWNDELIGGGRTSGVPLGMRYGVIAVDPSVAEQPRDECGIIVAKSTGGRHLPSRHAYVVEDASVHGSPDVWAKRVVETWEKWQFPVVVEVNQGGGLVRRVIHAINPAIPIFDVRAKEGKKLRAEPVALKYDQKRVHHVGYFPELESQMTSWVPEESKGYSPDRIDALVYAILALIVSPSPSFASGPVRARSAAGRSIPSTGVGPKKRASNFRRR